MNNVEVDIEHRKLLKNALREKLSDKVLDSKKPYVYICYDINDLDDKDCSVLQDVSEWIENGYNIYCDFEKDDENWVENTKKALQSSMCKLVICYETQAYVHNYKSLVEMLILRSDETRRFLRGKSAPIEIVKGTGIEEELSEAEIKALKYDGLTKDFGSENSAFKEELRVRLAEWFSDASEYQRIRLQNYYRSSEDLFRIICENYDRSTLHDFYSVIANTIMTWFKLADLTGNTKSSSKGCETRFKMLGIYNSNFESRSIHDVSFEKLINSLRENLNKSSFSNGIENLLEMKGDNSCVITYRENKSNFLQKTYDGQVHKIEVLGRRIIADDTYESSLEYVSEATIASRIPFPLRPAEFWGISDRIPENFHGIIIPMFEIKNNNSDQEFNVTA